MKEEVITTQALKKMLDYSASLPTGTTIGKRWRAKFRDSPNSDWMIGEYIEHRDPGKVGIQWTWAVSAPGVIHSGALDE